jgi:hypothetical protein
MTDDRYELAPNVVFTPTGADALLLRLDDETVFALNATGARTVQLAIDGLDERTLLGRLATEYATSPAAIEAETIDLLSALVAGGLLRRVGTASVDG